MNNKTSIKKSISRKPVEILINNPIISSETLFLFSSYISSNPNFKYNSTYLTDIIDVFSEDVAKFEIKIKKFEGIANEIYLRIKNRIKVDLIFDEVICFKMDQNNQCIRKIYEEKIDSFKLNEIGKKNFTIKFICEYEDNLIMYLFYFSDFTKFRKRRTKTDPLDFTSKDLNEFIDNLIQKLTIKESEKQ